jgi:hypothetical protein
MPKKVESPRAAVYYALIEDLSAQGQLSIFSVDSAGKSTEKIYETVYIHCRFANRSGRRVKLTLANTIKSEILASGPRTTCSAMKPAVTNILCEK